LCECYRSSYTRPGGAGMPRAKCSTIWVRGGRALAIWLWSFRRSLDRERRRGRAVEEAREDVEGDFDTRVGGVDWAHDRGDSAELGGLPDHGRGVRHQVALLVHADFLAERERGLRDARGQVGESGAAGRGNRDEHSARVARIGERAARAWQRGGRV